MNRLKSWKKVEHIIGQWLINDDTNWVKMSIKFYDLFESVKWEKKRDRKTPPFVFDEICLFKCASPNLSLDSKIMKWKLMNWRTRCRYSREKNFLEKKANDKFQLNFIQEIEKNRVLWWYRWDQIWIQTYFIT